METTPSSPSLNSCQKAALSVLQGAANVFVTGVAGSGKSFLIQHYLRAIEKYAGAQAGRQHPVLASTGAAAILIGGRTFHSYFGLGIMQGGVAATVKRALENKRVVKRLQKTRSVIIDEVSMLSGLTIRAAEAIARQARESEEPWGGIRVIAVGDFAQLPPVTQFDEARDWAFLDPTWELSEFAPALLRTTIRTRDGDFLKVLNSVREGVLGPTVVEFLNARLARPEDVPTFEGTRLFPHRETVERFNLERLEKIEGRPHEFPTEYFGDERAVADLKKSAPIPELLRLKEGALVMIRQNDPQLRWVNGSLGLVEKIDGPNGVLRVRLMDRHSAVELDQASFSILNAEGIEIASARNFPVNLAYATTIHKAQGMTLDRVMVDLRNLWEPGQAYVALSRARTGAGVHVTAWTPSSIRMDDAVASFYRRIDGQAMP